MFATDPNVQVVVEKAKKELDEKMRASMRSIEARQQEELDRIARLIGPVKGFTGKLGRM